MLSGSSYSIDSCALVIPQVLFCKLTSAQRGVYLDILDSDEVAAVLAKRIMPFKAITTLRKLCNHPALAYRQGRVVWAKNAKLKSSDSRNASRDRFGKQDKDAVAGRQHRRSLLGSTRHSGHEYAPPDDDDDDNDDDDDAADGDFPLDEVTWEDSGKLVVLSKVLPLWHREGHKVLLFSQTQSMLNLIEVLLRDQFKFRFMRLDGSTPVGKRQGIIETFNKDASVFLMLLTTRTGGVGISLTAANRVVLLDPDWNPQTDVQV